MNRHACKLTFCCAVLLMTVCAAGAATVSWVGGSGDWNTATNWSTGALPGTSDDVVVSSTNTSITVTHSSGTHTVKSLVSQRAFQLTGGSLTVSNTVQVNNTFTLAGGTLVRATVLQDTNGSSIQVTANSTLDGVVLNANAVVQSGTACTSVALTVGANGLTLNGTLTLQRANSYYYTDGAGYLSFTGSQTLGGAGQVVFGDTGGDP